MGWFWNSTSSSVQTPSATTSEAPSASASVAPASLPSAPPPQPQPSVPSREPTRDELADAELQSFLASLEREEPARPPPSITPFRPGMGPVFPKPPTSTSSQSTSPAPSPPPPSSRTSDLTASDIAPSALYPTSMSCRETFDQAFYCQSIGGQFNNIYRYGELRSCSDHWSAFWFCMRTKSLSDEERAEKIRDHYRSRDRKYRIGASSEDVWEMRTEPVREAFHLDPDAVED